MSILITGGAGYIGSHMAHWLRDQGRDFIVLDDLSTGDRSNTPHDAPFYQGDVADEKHVAKIIKQHKISAIIHFAAKIVVPDSVANPLGYYLANTVKTRALIQSAVDCGVKHIIFSSTAAVYGNPAQTPVPENAPLSPMSPYGTSKLMSEMMLRDASLAHPLSHMVLRYFNVAGADPKGRTGQSTPNATHLIKVAVQTALGMREKMQVFGTDYPTRDGTCIRDYIHVSDLVEAHGMALQSLENGGASQTFNCGYGDGFTVDEVIAAVKKVSGRDFMVERAPRRAGDPASIVADASKIRKNLGWQPKFNNLETIVTQALEWERRLMKNG